MNDLTKLLEVIRLDSDVHKKYRLIKNYTLNEEYRYHLVAKLLEQALFRYQKIINSDKYYKEHAVIYSSNIQKLFVKIIEVITVLKKIEQKN